VKFLVRNTHKYLSFFISLQLLLWTVSGIYFAFNKIELVRGEQYRVATPIEVNFDTINFNVSNATSITIKKRLGETIVIAKMPDGLKYFNNEGEVISQITKEEAISMVMLKTSLKPTRVEEISEPKRGSEYRGRDLPIYKVLTKNDEGESINVYLNIYSGDIASIRSDQWRTWDLMWGFHIMDWTERDNISNLLLKIFSILALISSISGLMLFFRIDFKK
tara:strand:- start:2471 stop:3130 length:660 start_codon:yes stop_codon:yes gene_type:complete